MPHLWGVSKTQQAVAKIDAVFFSRLAHIRKLLLALCIVVVSCGQPDEFNNSENNQETTDKLDEIHLDINRNAPFSLLETIDSAPLNVVPDSIVVVLSGCDSKFSTIHDTAQSGFTLYITKHDTNCVLGLRSVTIRGVTFTNTTGGDFSGSGTAIFANSTNNQKLTVRNTATLPSPIISGAKVAFALSEFLPGRNNFQLLMPGSSGSLLSDFGSEGPLLKWFNGAGPANLVNVSASDVPTYRVKLECNGTTFETRNPLTSSLCKKDATQQQLGEYYLRLIDDTYENGTTLSVIGAKQFFGYNKRIDRMTPIGPGVVKVDLASKVFDSSATNMGGIVVDLYAPSKLSRCKSHLVLVLHNPTGNTYVSNWSFTYFNLDFSTTAKTCSR